MNDLVLVQGMDDTKLALARWNRDPGAVLGPWLRLSLLIVCGLLAADLADRHADHARRRPRYLIPGLNAPATATDYLHVLYRNSLVLALHALACVAGFIAGSSLPLSAAKPQRPLALGAREGRASWRSASSSAPPSSRSRRRPT